MTQPVQADQSLADRYGVRPAAQRRRTWAVALGVVLAVLVGWVVWATVGSSGDQVGALVQSYQVTSPHQMSVTVQVTRTSGDAVRCTVSAIATDHSTVGESVITLPAGRSGTIVATTAVKTERAATSADVGQCH